MVKSAVRRRLCSFFTGSAAAARARRSLSHVMTPVLTLASRSLIEGGFDDRTDGETTGLRNEAKDGPTDGRTDGRWIWSVKGKTQR